MSKEHSASRIFISFSLLLSCCFYNSPFFPLVHSLCRFLCSVCCIYFDQRLGTAHSKPWSKYIFWMFFLCLKAEKRKKKQEILCKIWPKTLFFLNISSNFLLFLPFFSFLEKNQLKKHISTSIWSGQHPNASWNIQHLSVCQSARLFHLFTKLFWKDKTRLLDRSLICVWLDFYLVVNLCWCWCSPNLMFTKLDVHKIN